MSLLLWLGGFWRLWLPAGAVGLWLVLILANSTAPGAAAGAGRRTAVRVLRRLPTLAAGAVAMAALALGAGAVTVDALARSAIFFALQLALHPWSPLLLVLLATGAALLWLDAHHWRALDLLARWWSRLWVPFARLFTAIAPMPAPKDDSSPSSVAGVNSHAAT